MSKSIQAPVVRSLLENDLYNSPCGRPSAQPPRAQAEYAFVCRNSPAYPLAELKDDVEAELDRLCTLSFAEDELAYLRGLRFIKSDFVDFLSVFRFQRRFLEVRAVGEQLSIVARGPLVHVMAFEIFVLYIVNELYFRRLPHDAVVLAAARERLAAKIALVRASATNLVAGDETFTFIDFGLRRRYSGAWHDEVVRTLVEALPEHFRGTSNVTSGQQCGLIPIGTMAHE